MKSPRQPDSSIFDYLSYDPETGEFTWVKMRSSTAMPGHVCKCLDGEGYITIRFDGRQYLGHRLAWFFSYGEMPSLSVDHINGVKSDNRISNLRLATPAQQQFNRPASTRNRTGVKGVCWRPDKQVFTAQIGVSGKPKHLGSFKTLEDAAAAYARASATVAAEFEHDSVVAIRRGAA